MIDVFLRHDGRIGVRAPFEMKEKMAALPGALWDKPNRHRHIPGTPASALALWRAIKGHQVTVDDGVRALLIQARDEIESQTHKTATDLPEIPGTMPAWLHQKRAYHFAKARAGTMLAMDMGTGKSRVAISLLDGWGSMSALIVAPRSVLNVWPNQFAVHSDRPWHVIVPKGRSITKRVDEIKDQWRLGMARGQPIAVIVNYEAFWRKDMLPALMDLLFDEPESVAILDESHRVKKPGGKASMAAMKLRDRSARMLMLTGTPMPHSPLDVYGQYRALDPGIFGTSYTKFRARYAVMGGYQGRQVIDLQNEGDLAEKFGSAAFIVSKKDAGLNLPPVTHQDVPVDMDPSAVPTYRQMADEFIVNVEGGIVTADNALVKLLRLGQISNGFVSDDDKEIHELGSWKTDALEDILEGLPPREPVVVFGRFHHDLDEIAMLCAKMGRGYGEVSGRLRPGSELWGLNERSQFREDLDVVALQLQSGGVGIDLTRAAYCVYYSMGYSLGDYEQSLARLDRPGQTRPVTYLHLVTRGTVDRVVYRALRERKEVVTAIIDAAKGGEDL